MKKLFFIKAFLIVLILVPMNQGCTNLDEEVFDQLTSDNFPTTQEQFISSLGAAYSRLYGWAGHNSLMSLNEVSTDEILIPQRGADWFDGGQWLRVHQHNYNFREESLNNGWNFCYSGISDCNRVIELFEGLVADGNVDANLAAGFISELKVLRALFYYWLVDSWGNVPVVTDFANAEASPATVARADVYKFIIDELNANVPNLEEAKNASTYGRMNYYAGQALLAKMYLNAEVYTGTAQWQACIDACDEIINSNLYGLESDYFVNFNSDNAGSNENILVIPYDRVFATGFVIPQMTLHYSSQATFDLQQQPWNGYCTLQEFYNSYEDDDVRKGTPGNQKIRGNFHAGAQFASDGTTRLEDSGFETDDPDGAPLTFTPEINELEPNCLRQAGARVGKYEYALGQTPDLDNDFPIFRYGDILLMKAEALHRLGRTGEGQPLFDQVRGRSVQTALPLNDENLLAERGREMFYEGWRRSDLIRFGKYNDAWWEKAASDPKKNIFPIPEAQLSANTNLKQNDGY